MERFDYRLYFVVGTENCERKNLLWTIEEAIIGGVDLIQLREKNLPDKDFLALAKKAKAICRQYRIPLIINDNLWVAQQADADGVHVGNSDINPIMIRQLWPECKLLGYSADLPAHLHNEFASASDYIAISPVFKTATKEDTINEWGIEGLREARKWTQKPLVAIGGIHPQEVIPILETGVQSICVVSEIAAKSSPRTAAANLKQLITNYYESI